MKWHCEMSLWAYSWSISTKRQEYSKLLNAKKKLSSSTITALFWLLDHTYQANSCLKKQSRALAVDKYSSPVQIHLFQWYQLTKRFGACPLSSGCVKLMYVIWSAPSEQVNWVSVSYWPSFFSELALLRKEGSLWWLDLFTTLPASVTATVTFFWQSMLGFGPWSNQELLCTTWASHMKILGSSPTVPKSHSFEQPQVWIAIGITTRGSLFFSLSVRRTHNTVCVYLTWCWSLLAGCRPSTVLVNDCDNSVNGHSHRFLCLICSCPGRRVRIRPRKSRSMDNT